MTGLTRETVTKELRKLEEEGLITVRQKHIRLTERGAKAMLATAHA